MKLQERVTEQEDDNGETFQMRVIDGYYSIEEDGYNGQCPVIHIVGRDIQGNWRHVTFDHYRPYFLVPKTEYIEKAQDIDSDRRVLDVTDDCRNGLDPDTIIQNEELVKIIVECPWHTRELRDYFDRVWEGDVRFIQRFLVDRGVSAFAEVTGFEGSDTPLKADAITGVEAPDDGDVQTDVRICTFDIEVLDEGEEVVTRSGTERAAQPITAITAHDSYTDEYKTWALDPGDWGSTFSIISDINVDVDFDLDIYTSEERMLDEWWSWVVDKQFDVLTGWNCVPEGTPILMGDGSERAIESIDEGDTVVGIEGGEFVHTTVNATSPPQEKDTAIIKTETGKSVEYSTDHRVLVGDNESISWKHVRDVEEGDYIVRPQKLPSDNNYTFPEDPYLLGLIASDGSFNYGEGVRFYNNDIDLHVQFPTENELSVDGKGCHSQRVFTDSGRSSIVEEIENLGIPTGNKKDKEWDLSNIYNSSERDVERFLAGYMDGDGTVGECPIFCIANETARYWIKRLCQSLGIHITGENDDSLFVSSGSVDEFNRRITFHMNSKHKIRKLLSLEKSKSGHESTIPPCIATHRREEDDRTGFRIINDKIRRGINVKRWEAREVNSPWSERYTDAVFERVTSVESGETKICYDIDTSANSFIADDVVVHNSNSFDSPYAINRSFELEVWTVRELSPTRDVVSCDGEGRWINSDVEGVHLFDLLDGFRKTSFHSLKSNTLSNVAAAVTDVEKMDLAEAIDAETSREHDEAWYNHPSKFIQYNIADTVATVKINEARNIL